MIPRANERERLFRAPRSITAFIECRDVRLLVQLGEKDFLYEWLVFFKICRCASHWFAGDLGDACRNNGFEALTIVRKKRPARRQVHCKGSDSVLSILCFLCKLYGEGVAIRT